METKSTAAAAKNALRTIFSVRNTVMAGLVTSAFAVGSVHGYDFYENALEERDMETLPEHLNSVYPTNEDGDVDWDDVKEWPQRALYQTLGLD